MLWSHERNAVSYMFCASRAMQSHAEPCGSVTLSIAVTRICYRNLVALIFPRFSCNEYLLLLYSTELVCNFVSVHICYLNYPIVYNTIPEPARLLEMMHLLGVWVFLQKWVVVGRLSLPLWLCLVAGRLIIIVQWYTIVWGEFMSFCGLCSGYWGCRTPSSRAE